MEHPGDVGGVNKEFFHVHVVSAREGARHRGVRARWKNSRPIDPSRRARATEKLPARVAVWAEKVGVQPGAVLIRDQKKRWGSCDAKGNLRFNWRVVQLPMRLVDYVVAHEVVHLRHADHGAAFWADLERALPDSTSRRDVLRTSVRGVTW